MESSAEYTRTASPLAHEAAAFKEQVRRRCELLAGQSSPIAGRAAMQRAPTGPSGVPAGAASPRQQRSVRPEVFGEPSPIRVHPHLKIKVSEVRRSADCRPPPHHQQTGFDFDEAELRAGRGGQTVPGGRMSGPLSEGEPWSDDDAAAALAMFPDRDPFPRPPPAYSTVPALRRQQLQQQQEQQQQPWSSGDGITVSPSEFRVDLVVAGYSPDELQVDVEGRDVVVRGRHGEPARRPGEPSTVTRHFSRRYALPTNALADRASVVLARGATLSIRVPRRTAVPTRTGEGGTMAAEGQGRGEFADHH